MFSALNFLYYFDVFMIAQTTLLIICIHIVKSIGFAIFIKFCDQSNRAIEKGGVSFAPLATLAGPALEPLILVLKRSRPLTLLFAPPITTVLPTTSTQ